MVAQFGPTLGSDPVVTGPDDEKVWVADGWQAERPAGIACRGAAGPARRTRYGSGR